MKVNMPVTQREVKLKEDQTIISMTDLKGAITYVNNDFLDISGFEENELVGVNHNVVRHPDMPALAYKDLWDTVKAGKPWRGIVKNRCKNGDFYWVEAFVTPIIKSGKIIGYQSVRSKATQQQIDKASELYEKITSQNLTSLPTKRDYRLRVSTQFKLLQSVWLLLLGSAFATSYFDSSIGLIGISSAAVCLYVFGFFWVNSQVIKPVREMAKTTKAISNGYLNVRVVVDKPGAMGETQLGLDMIRAKIRATIGRVQEASSDMAVATDQLASMSGHVDMSMQSQMTETEMIATAVQEMSSTVQEVAGSTVSAAEAADDAQQNAEAGRNIVERNIRSISGLSADISGVETLIQLLNEDCSKIDTILEVISDVADQTNLLALNAAIEAARAGEKGRGFAVVADEVRALALRVQSSTDEIQKMIQKLQSGAGAAVNAMVNSRESAQASVKEAEEAGEALEHINSTVKTIQDLSTQIATAAEEQSAVSEEMSRNIVEISDHSFSTAKSSQEALQACNELVGTARRLNALTEDYVI
ncbi:PAS domain-containing methyl-accepting chemotaxis protein [Neptunomonas sp.]|uniref:methyl-accepting chemotaxis protein n=1 Tax=Neptunomonas sp. TaxID=1971898 RepID=UPI0025FC2D00|nr:PAS domain-containing methyl-accepting chemotaxis protein [Neptunomonas sp.]